MSTKGEEMVIGSVIVSVLLFALWAISMGVTELTTSQRCLALGWPRSDITWKYERYCKALVLGTEQTAVLEELEERAGK